MNNSSSSSSAFGSAHPQQDQLAQTHSSLVGSQGGTPAPDRHHTQPLTPPQPTLERSFSRRAAPDQASLQPHDEIRVDSQRESISSSGNGQGSQDTVTRLPTSGTLTQANQTKTSPSPAPSTSRQLPANPFASPDGRGTSNADVDTTRSSTNSPDIRRQAPLPPLPRTYNPNVSPSPGSSWIHPHYFRQLQSIGSAIWPHNLDNTTGIPSRSDVMSSPRISGTAPASSHGLETSRTSIYDPPVPGLTPNPNYPTVNRSRTMRSRDWLDTEEKEKSVGERLDPTLDTARIERDKYALKAKITGYTLNIAIGLQVLIGALTTGLSAATTGRQTSIMTAILGGIATLIASYLARARGSHEPELSTARVKDLDQFIRDCEIFQLDHGHAIGSNKPEQETRLHELRERFEELLGSGNGERRLDPPA